MYIDVLSPNGYISVNVKMAQVFGLDTAAYWAELMNIVAKAVEKGRVDDLGYFKVDRKYVASRTTVTQADQLIIDSKLCKIGVMRKKADSEDLMALDIKLMYSIVSNDDFELLSDVARKVRTRVNKETKESARKAVIASLRDHVQAIETNFDLIAAYRDWVDGVYAKPKGYLSNKLIEIFVQRLRAFYGSDVELAKRLIEIATVHGWRDADWVINAYKTDVAAKARPLAAGQLPPQVRATEASVSKKEY